MIYYMIDIYIYILYNIVWLYMYIYIYDPVFRPRGPPLPNGMGPQVAPRSLLFARFLQRSWLPASHLLGTYVAHILPQSTDVLPIVSYSYIYRCYVSTSYIHIVYMYTCIHACMHACMHTYIHTYTHIHTYTYLYIYIYLYIHTYLHIYIYLLIYTYIIHIYIYIYIYITTPPPTHRGGRGT